MGFDLLSLKKVEESNVTTHYFRHVVVGEDLFSIALFHELQKKYGEGQVTWVSPRPVNEKDLLPIGPSLLRGEHNIAAFKRFFPDVTVEEFEAPSEFFKELKWRQFGGRAKSEKLLWNEEFYTQKRGEIDFEELFPFLKEEGLYERLEKARFDFSVKNLLKMTPDDLAEPANFQIELSNNDLLKCENLYWGLGPGDLLSAFNDKKELSDEFITYCEHAESPSALLVQLVFEKPITDKKETIFIPLSYTHEWGHFVGEFSSDKSGKQKAEFVTFMDMDHTNEDEISKKIRLLKKNLEKIFGDSAGLISDEFIKVTTQSPCLNFDDNLFTKVSDEVGQLRIASYNGPLEHLTQEQSSFEDSWSSVNNLARAAVRHQEVLNSLS